PRASEILGQISSAPGVRRLGFDTTLLGAWDTGLPTFLSHLIEESAKAEIEVDRSGLPTEVERLLSLASAVPMRTTAAPAGPPCLGRASASVFAAGAGAMEVLAFTGEVSAAVAGLVTGRVRMRWFQFALLVEEVGVRALPIMTLIGILIGIIL